MNLFIGLCKIIMTPRLYRYNNKALVKVYMSTLNNKKGLITYFVQAKATGRLGFELFDLYRKGDFILIEGSVSIKHQKKKIYQKNLKNKKFIVINVKQIHAAHIVFK